MVRIADIDVTGGNIGSLRLRVATQAQVGIVGYEQLFIY
jgi:hypothetical protein